MQMIAKSDQEDANDKKFPRFFETRCVRAFVISLERDMWNFAFLSKCDTWNSYTKILLESLG